MTEPADRRAPCLVGEFQPVTEIVVASRRADRHDRALAVGATFAEHWQLPLRVVHVREADDPVDSDHLEVTRAALSNQHRSIEVASTLVSGGSVAEAVRSVCSPTSFVVMSSDHANQSGGPSAAEDIVRRIGMAMIVGREADAEHVFGPVTVALDGSPTAEGALDAALAFAASIGAGVELIQVVDEATSAHVARLRHDGQRVSESGYLEGVAQQCGSHGVDVVWRVVHDEDPVAGLLGTVEGHGGGPIVVGSHGDSSPMRRMMGSTAMGLVARASHPILVVATAREATSELAP